MGDDEPLSSTGKIGNWCNNYGITVENTQKG